MIHRPLRIAACIAIAAAVLLHAGSTFADHAPVTIVSNATLTNPQGDSESKTTYTPTLSACTEYSVKLTHTMDPDYAGSGDNAVKVEVWNKNGSVTQPAEIVGELFDAPPPNNDPPGRQFLRSENHATDKGTDLAKFIVDCNDTSPEYTFEVYNYQPNSTMTYELTSLPGGQTH